jgi:HTH-type transcriptional regulator, sugar sensing transcriptional regulator
MELQDSLEQIGLTKRESLVYLELLKGALSPTEIAEKTGLKRPNVYDVLKSLEAKGLIHYQFKNKRRLISANSPQRLLDLSKQKFDLTKDLLPSLLSLDREQSFRSNITFYQGKKSMQELLSDFTAAKNKEAWFLTSPQDLDSMVGKDFVESIIQKRLKRGIKIRSLRPAEKESEYKEQTTTSYGRELTEVGYVPPNFTFSLNMGIYDEKVIFYSSKKESFGFMVESKEFSQVMRMMYENLWQHSGKLKH